MKTYRTLGIGFVFLFSFLLIGCDNLGKTPNQVLARIKVKHEEAVKYCSEAAVHNLIDEEEWNLFNTTSDLFILVHNGTVESFEMWQRKKTKANETRFTANLLNLSGIFQEVEDFGKGCKQRLDALTSTP